MGAVGFLGLFGSKAELSVTTDKSSYLPGEIVTATIRVACGKKDLEVEEGRAELVCENEYEYRQRDYTSRSVTEVDTHTTTERSVHGTERFLGAGTLKRGESADHAVSLQVPDDAVPTGKGEITEVRWKVEAILGRARAMDPDASAEVTVLSRRGAHASVVASQPERDTHGDCDLELQLPGGPHVRPRDSISGTLVVTPRTQMDAGEVRVELVRTEEVPRDAGNTREEVDAQATIGEGAGLSTSIPREYPFELAIPAGACPTLETEHSTLGWRLRGVVSRRLRSDYNIARPLNVYTSPEDAGSTEEDPDDWSAGLDVFKEPPGQG